MVHHKSSLINLTYTIRRGITEELQAVDILKANNEEIVLSSRNSTYCVHTVVRTIQY